MLTLLRNSKNQNNRPGFIPSLSDVSTRTGVFFKEKTMIGIPISGFPGYTITRDGVVRSYRKMGCIPGLCNKARVKKPVIANTGYYVISLQTKGKQYVKTIHRLLADAFIPNPHNYPQVLHKDDVKTNLDLSNLRWGNDTINRRDQYVNRQIISQKTRGNSKLTKDQVIEMREKYKSGKVTYRYLSEEYGICISSTHHIVNHRTWTWLL